MKRTSATEAARHFLSVIWDGPAPDDAEVIAALDRLIAAYHDTADVGPSDNDLEAPREEHDALYKQVADRFPDYGYYPTADPTLPPDEALMVGDAVDDIVDLTLDMREVVWLEENVALEDALWSFKLLFFHWGLHARELALYLHARQIG